MKFIEFKSEFKCLTPRESFTFSMSNYFFVSETLIGLIYEMPRKSKNRVVEPVQEHVLEEIKVEIKSKRIIKSKTFV